VGALGRAYFVRTTANGTSAGQPFGEHAVNPMASSARRRRRLGYAMSPQPRKESSPSPRVTRASAFGLRGLLAMVALVIAATGCHGDAAPPRPLGVDAGGEVDAGPALDAGPAMDAGPPMDAGTPVDAGPTIDAGTGVDAGPMCLPTQTLCGGLCKDLQTDRFHCGMCGMVCGRGQMCCAGTCRLGACL
jgi:hypothetical protein